MIGLDRDELILRVAQQLDEVPAGAIVIFSAHGVAKAVRAHAEDRGLKVFDATCPLVTKVHIEVSKMLRAGYEIVMIGHHGHPESEGTMGQSTTGMHLVETLQDVAELTPREPPHAFAILQKEGVELMLRQCAPPPRPENGLRLVFGEDTTPSG